jgi:hypothetical protein
MQLTSHEVAEAKQHLYIALDELDPLPRTHEQLIEQMREYFSDQKVAVFSKMVARIGEAEFRDFIAETVVESGKYYRAEDGQVRVKE